MSTATEPVPPAPGARDALAADLRRAVDGEVRFDAGSRHLYATDASVYRQVPIGVVLPRHTGDVEATVAVCREHGVPITGRGAGTSLAGQATNVAVVLDFTRHMDRLVDLDPDAKVATVQPGLVLDRLREAANAHGLTFGPDPSTHERCTLGGMIGNNACGVHSVLAGRTVDNVHALDALLYDGTRLGAGPLDADDLAAACARPGRVGELHRALVDLRDRHADLVRERFPDIPRRVSGYNLDALLPEHGFDTARALVGTEGTCAITLEAEVRLVDWPAHRVVVVLGYPSVAEAADHVPAILAHGPIGLEGVDGHLAVGLGAGDDGPGLLPAGRGWLLVELGGATPDAARARAQALVDDVAGAGGPDARLHHDPVDQARLWRVRASGIGTSPFRPGERDRWPGWEDAAVGPDRLGEYLRGFQRLLADHDLEANLYGHFGDGCVHSRISFDHTTEAGVASFARFTEQAADLVVSHGGSLSGEHGDGQARADLLERMFGRELVAAFGEFKRIFDPDGRMNPGKVVDPRPRTADLRGGPGHAPRDPGTRLDFTSPTNPTGSFARETQRCVGIGLCRRDGDTGTMCPSWQATHEEEHSTRGRAHLLYEMLQPGTDLDGWADTSVHDALDLCLSCKGCKVDCPVGVDVAAYKSEFLSHHYDGRRRPLAHHLLGRVDRWLELASHAPRLANALGRSPLAGLRGRVGITTERPVPELATETLRRWYARRGSRAAPDAPTVTLLPDTFVDHLDPAVGRATIRVLEAAGYRVVLPPPVCCGRPLYDHGMLDEAERYLERLVEVLGPHVVGDGLVVGMEPSCVAVLRDELGRLRGGDPAARRLAERTRTLAELLVDDADWHPPRLARRALVHPHCHQTADLGTTADATLLDRLGLDWAPTDAGCCGLAGGFGFRADAYDVSRQVGEGRLLPAIRGADDATLLIADGFSCRTQIAHLQDRRRALHLAEVACLALDGDPAGPDGRPEDGVVAGGSSSTGRVAGRWRPIAAVAVAATVVVVVSGWWRRRARSGSFPFRAPWRGT